MNETKEYDIDKKNGGIEGVVVVTAAELLRRKQQRKKSNIVTRDMKQESDVKSTNNGSISNISESKPLVVVNEDNLDEDDIEEKIKRLEAMIQQGGRSDDDDDNYRSDNKYIIDDDSLSDSERESDFNTTSPPNVGDDYQKGVLVSSILETERIDGLSDAYLPKVKRRKLKGIDSATDVGDNNDTKLEKATRKRRRKDASDTDDKNKNSIIPDEIRNEVNKILGNYVARSSEKLPYYCRYCSKQYTNETEFVTHKASSFHKAAVELERKKSYCKLCRKQLTSPVQLQDHIKSKPHKDRLQSLQQRQHGNNNSNNKNRRQQVVQQPQRRHN